MNTTNTPPPPEPDNRKDIDVGAALKTIGIILLFVVGATYGKEYIALWVQQLSKNPLLAMGELLVVCVVGFFVLFIPWAIFADIRSKRMTVGELFRVLAKLGALIAFVVFCIEQAPATFWWCGLAAYAVLSLDRWMKKDEVSEQKATLERIERQLECIAR
jgi:hypothetical protein